MLSLGKRPSCGSPFLQNRPAEHAGKGDKLICRMRNCVGYHLRHLKCYVWPSRPAKTAFRRLAALARGQGGYFTAKQAAEIGYGYPHLVYHVSAGALSMSGTACRVDAE